MLRFARARNPLVLEYATALLQVLKQDNLLVEFSGLVRCFFSAILGQLVMLLWARSPLFGGIQNPEVKRSR